MSNEEQASVALPDSKVELARADSGSSLGGPVRQESLVRIAGRQRGRSGKRRTSAGSDDISVVSDPGRPATGQLADSPSLLLELEKSVTLFKYPKSYLYLDFHDPDMERLYRSEYDEESTPVFRGWTVLFLIFHIATFMGRDVWEFDSDTIKTTLIYSRIPSIFFAVLFLGLSYQPFFETINKQRFFAISLLIQQVFLISVTFTTLEGAQKDDEVAFPNAVIGAMVVGYTAYRLRTNWATLVGWTAQAMTTLTFVGYIVFGWNDNNLTWTALIINIPMAVFNVLGMMTSYQIESTERKNWATTRRFLRECALTEYESRRGEYILYNILPSRIVQRLQSQPTIAERIPSATVMFLCIENLIDMTSSLTTSKSIQLMNDLFDVCDKRAEEFGVEKVKTINDKYMCVSGAPDKRPDHAQQMADMALAIWRDFGDMRAASAHLDFSTRAGMSSGPIVAGVIGLKKFCWDIWGDTVNTASRMEYPKGGKKMSGAIRISPFTYELIKDSHNCEFSGQLEVKGKGLLNTYLLKARDSGLAKPVDVDEVNVDDNDDDDDDIDEPGKDVTAFMKSAHKRASMIQSQLRDGLSRSPSAQSADFDGSDDEVKEEDVKLTDSSQIKTSSSVELHRKASAPIRPLRLRRKSRITGGQIQKYAKRRSAIVKAREVPRLDFEAFYDNFDFEIPAYRTMTREMKQQFAESRFTLNMHDWPTLWFSLLVAIVCYALLGVMDPILASGVTSRVYIVRALVILLWLAHLGVSWLPMYSVRVSYVLAAVSILVMVVAGSYIHREVEDAGVIKGGEFYAVLPVVFAIYLGYSVYAMSTLWLSITIVATFIYLIVESVLGYTVTSEASYFFLYLAGLAIFGLWVSFTLEKAALKQWHIGRGARKEKKKIQTKHEEADRLLQNIVPQQIIPSLKSFSHANKVNGVSILFSDISGFTAMSKNLEPYRLVNWLNGFFTIFDNLAERHHIEKIKTIGDAYVACGGLFEDQQPSGKNHVDEIVNMAIELQAELTARNESKKGKSMPISLRVGIHVGDVLAGIIGKRKFQYDIFGHAVVLAEEMESGGVVGKVHISDPCRGSLTTQRNYKFKEHNGVEKRDGTHMKSWLVEKRGGKGDRSKLAKMFGARTIDIGL